MSRPLQPILVVLVYRGGERFRRALASIDRSEDHFRRVVISVTGPRGGHDMRAVEEYQRQRAEAGRPSKVELICSGVELRTMDHQRFWIDYVQHTGARPDDWIYWLAYDDEVRPAGIERITDEAGNWSLEPGTASTTPSAIPYCGTGIPLPRWRAGRPSRCPAPRGCRWPSGSPTSCGSRRTCR